MVLKMKVSKMKVVERMVGTQESTVARMMTCVVKIAGASLFIAYAILSAKDVGGARRRRHGEGLFPALIDASIGFAMRPRPRAELGPRRPTSPYARAPRRDVRTPYASKTAPCGRGRGTAKA
jgi:hypothetical protein